MILLDALVADIIWEVIRFIIFACLIVGGVMIGKKLRDHTDAKKASQTGETIKSNESEI